jgi:ectoine hydroxylase-related dioxygenase (phytanoyl-CoA dioxygenase family)
MTRIDRTFIIVWLFMFLFILIFVYFLIMFSTIENYLHFENKNHSKNLRDYGITNIKEVFNESEIKQLKNFTINNNLSKIKTFVENSRTWKQTLADILGNEYVMNDYVFLIKKSCIHTCHRDYNNQYYNKDQQYPSYTFIIYLENMEKCLDVIPGSQKSKNENDYNVKNRIMHVPCNQGDVLLFDANLIHSGSINKNNENLRVQMKLCHKSDYNVLDFYNNYYKIMDETSGLNTMFPRLQKHISCQYPGLTKYFKNYDRNLNTKFENPSKIHQWISNMYPKLKNV